MWGVGCVFGEMFLRKPILPGSSDPDQLEKIWNLCGTPNQQDWPHHDTLPTFDALRFRQSQPRKVRNFFAPMVDCEEALDLLDKMLICNPKTRVTAGQALLHDWFWIDPLPAELGRYRQHITCSVPYPALTLLICSLPIYEASHEMDRRNRGGPPPGFRPPGPQGPPPNHHPGNHNHPGRRNNRFVPPPLSLQQAQINMQQTNGNGPNFATNFHNPHGHPPPPGPPPLNIPPPTFMNGHGPGPRQQPALNLPPHLPHARHSGPPPLPSISGPSLPPLPLPPNNYNGPPLPMFPPPPNTFLPAGYPPDLNPNIHGYVPPPISDPRNPRWGGGGPGPHGNSGGGGGGGGRRWNGGLPQNANQPPPSQLPQPMSVDHKAVGLPPKPPGVA
jgi:serine/threonine-protein kinase BUR1